MSVTRHLHVCHLACFQLHQHSIHATRDKLRSVPRLSSRACDESTSCNLAVTPHFLHFSFMTFIQRGAPRARPPPLRPGAGHTPPARPPQAKRPSMPFLARKWAFHSQLAEAKPKAHRPRLRSARSGSRSSIDENSIPKTKRGPVVSLAIRSWFAPRA